MFREAEKYLLEWHQKSERKPLLIRGARQVGKSTLVRLFASNNKVKLLEINLEKNLQLEPLFKKLEVNKLLKEFESICSQSIDKNTLIFIDEIQAIPEALHCLRYFYEERPELSIVAAGSLVEFALTSKKVSFPVGRLEYLYLGGMTFNEFLIASGEKQLSADLKNYTIGDYFSVSAHQKLLPLFRDYLLVGGMPEAVKSFIAKRNFQDISQIQLNLIQNYQDDFSKYAHSENLAEMLRVFRQIAGQVGEKTVYSKIDRELKIVKIKNYLELFAKAQIISRCFYSSADGLPLSASEDSRIFKTFLLDVGLLCNLKNIKDLSEEEIQSAKFINEGKIAEQYVAQHLCYSADLSRQPELYYWLNEGRSANSQIDFIAVISGKILPIEVKAGSAGSMKSIFYFCALKKLQTAVRFDLNPPSVFNAKHSMTLPNAKPKDVEVKIISLPLYLAGEMQRLLA